MEHGSPTGTVESARQASIAGNRPWLDMWLGTSQRSDGRDVAVFVSSIQVDNSVGCTCGDADGLEGQAGEFE